MKKNIIEVFRQVMGRSLTDLDLLDLAQLPKRVCKMDQAKIFRYNQTISSFQLGQITEEQCLHRMRTLTGLMQHDVAVIVKNLKAKSTYPILNKSDGLKF